MADFCNNIITFKAPQAQFNKFYNLIRDDLKDNRLNLLKLFPISETAPAPKWAIIPKYFETFQMENHPLWYRVHWYQYNVENFGTKWVEYIEIENQVLSNNQNDQILQLKFKTAWSPLNKSCVLAISQKYQIDIEHIYYGDENYLFYGLQKVKDGVYEQDEQEVDNKIAVKLEDYLYKGDFKNKKTKKTYELDVERFSNYVNQKANQFFDDSRQKSKFEQKYIKIQNSHF